MQAASRKTSVVKGFLLSNQGTIHNTCNSITKPQAVIKQMLALCPTSLACHT
jgi:hypothetical protein